MWLAFPTLFDFGAPPQVPRAFRPTCHIFYGMRVIDIDDELPKWSGHKDEFDAGVTGTHRSNGAVLAPTPLAGSQRRRAMKLDETDYDNAETGCCARLDAQLWDGRKLEWNDKPFVKDHVRSFLHIPLNFGSVMSRDHAAIEEAEAYSKEPIWLTDEVSPSGGVGPLLTQTSRRDFRSCSQPAIRSASLPTTRPVWLCACAARMSSSA